MSKAKKLYIFILIFIIAAFCIWFVILDFSRFAAMDYTYDIFPSALLKRVNVVLAVLVAWAAGKDGLGPVDCLKMKGAFLFAFLAEVLLAVRLFKEGIVTFALCQLLLTFRNGAGIKSGFKHAGLRQKIGLAVAAVILLIILAAIPPVTGILDSSNSLFTVAYFYGIILSISLWTAVASAVLELLPRRNAGMVAWGMVCFFFCDICVGLDGFLPPGLPWLIANSLIWVFYIPALVLLALSCYKY